MSDLKTLEYELSEARRTLIFLRRTAQDMRNHNEVVRFALWQYRDSLHHGTDILAAVALDELVALVGEP